VKKRRGMETVSVEEGKKPCTDTKNRILALLPIHPDHTQDSDIERQLFVWGESAMVDLEPFPTPEMSHT